MKSEAIARLLQPFKTRLANILTRSKVVSVDSSQPVYVVLSTVRGKPNAEKIPMMQHFGFASVPPKDADQVRAHLSSDPDNPLIIASLDQESQPVDLLEGDSALFDDKGKFIKLLLDKLSIVSPSKRVEIITGQNIDLSAENVNIAAQQTNLGVGGNRIARLGDEIQVQITAGSSQGTYTGTITSAGNNTSI